MDRKIFNEKVAEMLPEIMESVKFEADRLFGSGFVDVDGHDNDSYLLPKLCLFVALNNVADGMRGSLRGRDVLNLGRA